MVAEKRDHVLDDVNRWHASRHAIAEHEVDRQREALGVCERILECQLAQELGPLVDGVAGELLE